MRFGVVAALIVACVLAGCASREQSSAPVPPPPAASAGDVAFGKRVLNDTQHAAQAYARARLNCSSCHLADGLKQNGEYLGAAFVRYPRFSPRAGHMVSLTDRLTECFLRSMNGTAPPADGPVMRGLVAYLRSLHGKKRANVAPPAVVAALPPSTQRGAAIYQARCSACHGTNGAGAGPFPPLWGSASFNDGAGMASVAKMAAFVRANMPLGSPPNTLSAQESVDVSAFVESHARPHFDGTKLVGVPPRAASTY